MLILGGGLAGVACAHKLGDEGVPVTLVDRNDYHQFQPLLYQVATSQLLPRTSPGRIGRSSRITPVTVVTEDVVAANLAERSLTLSDGRTLTGSHVVMAAGACPNFFGVPGAEQHAFRSTRWPTPSGYVGTCSDCCGRPCPLRARPSREWSM